MILVPFLFLYSILVESTLTTLPLTLSLIIFSAAILRKNEVFFAAFISGFFLDILVMRTIGISSAYFVTVVCLIYLYKRKFEIDNIAFTTTFSMLSSFGFLFIHRIPSALSQSILTGLIMFFAFLAFKKFNKKTLKYA
jgi:cell shape-determining protein MreD